MPPRFHGNRENSHKGQLRLQVPRSLHARLCSTEVTKQAWGQHCRGATKLRPRISNGPNRRAQSITSINPAISVEKYGGAGMQGMMGAATGLMRMTHVTSQPWLSSAPIKSKTFLFSVYDT